LSAIVGYRRAKLAMKDAAHVAQAAEAGDLSDFFGGEIRLQ
jgi:hypothetical protein